MSGTIRRLGSGRPTGDLPLELADLHRALDPGDRLVCRLEPVPDANWCSQQALDLVVGAGFRALREPVAAERFVELDLERIHSLPDTVAPRMRILVVGLNPSPYSSDGVWAMPGLGTVSGRPPWPPGWPAWTGTPATPWLTTAWA